MIELSNVSIYFEMQRHRIRRRLMSGHAVGGETVTYRGKPHIAALQDISISLPLGSKVAVIGANGAGKTTLLRTMAGIYQPHNGQVHTEGRLSTLFSNAVSLSDYETGRQNLLLSGLLRGLTMSSTQEHLQDVVEFTGLEPFLDQPIISFSEGMKVRLGIAMAALANPNVLLVDEVLGTSDSQFLDRTAEKFPAFTAPDRTLVLASHLNDLIDRFCDQAIWLENGKLRAFGPLEEVREKRARFIAS